MKTIINPNRNFYTIKGNVALYSVDKVVGNITFYAIIFESNLAHHFSLNPN